MDDVQAALAHGHQDADVADFLARDLQQRGIAVTRDTAAAAPLLLVVGPASAGDADLQAVAAQAAGNGRPIHVVRVGDGHYDWPSLRGAASWTDAHGPAAAANVASLATRLREAGQPSAYAAAPPPRPYAAPPQRDYAAPFDYGAGASQGNYGSPHHPAPPRSNKGLIIGGIVAALAILCVVAWLVLAPESRESVDRRMAEQSSARRSTLSDEYLREAYWCDSAGGRMHFRGGVYQSVSFFRNSNPNSLVLEARYALSGNQLTITAPNGRPTVSTVSRIDDRTMSFTAPGRPVRTFTHCS